MSYKKFNILIPGAGGYGAVNTIKSLKSAGVGGRIIAIDSDSLSAGFIFADKSYVIPEGVGDDFLEKSIDIIKKEKINVIFPTCEYAALFYSGMRSLMKRLNVFLAMSDYGTIKLCSEKRELYKKLSDIFPIPYIRTPEQVNPEKDFPLIFKPSISKGSNNIFLCKNMQHVKLAKSAFKPFVLQEYLPGEEYTVDALSDFKGKYFFSVARKRLGTLGGVATKGEVIIDNKVEALTRNIANFLKLKGPYCIQFKRDRKNNLKLIDVNPRLGGASIMATLAGFNIPLYILKLISKEKLSKPKIKEIKIVRYFQEEIIK